jgi:hypothetical protein
MSQVFASFRSRWGGTEATRASLLRATSAKRYALFNINEAVHADEHQSDWTRADAILAVAILSALLSVRNP